MKKTIILTTIFLLVAVGYANSQTGKWKSYLSYDQPTEIEEASGNILYVLASKGLYSYNKNDHSLQIYDKTTVLNDCGIAHIAWCKAAKRLVIVYENHNIDLLEQNSNVLNMADYLNKSMTSDKTVYGIDISGKYAYLATGFGIVKLNVADAEISDTYQLGFKVDYSYTEGPYLYAASSTDGLYRGLLTDNLLDKAKWTRVGNFTARPKTMDPNNLALVKTLNPGGPKYNNFGFMKMVQGKLYTVGRGYNVIKDLSRPGCIQVLSNDKWNIFQDQIDSITGNPFINLNCIDIDPKDINRVFVSGRTGVYEFQNGLFYKMYSYDNSPLISAFTNKKDYVMVQGLGFDRNGSLWCLNSMNNQENILEYNTNREWVSHRSNALINDNKGLVNMQNIMFDSRNLMWFVNDSYVIPSLYVYQASSETVIAYKSFVNEDGTSVNVTNVRCVTEDNHGNVWVGTNLGPLYLAPDQIYADKPVFTQVKVPRNDGTNYADYLLSGIDISCIAVDQANRKWFGTNGNGVYLISSNNIQQIEHFTAENSDLLSNNIESIAMNEKTGEVFFGTDRGLCSYMSNATTAAQGMTKDNVYAYPNPVRPDYTGPITITGLDENADIKIVTVNGTLVNEGKSLGGKYKWYGLNKFGQRVASGVYMVEVATQEGEKGVVCKIAIVN